jgi:hypothetical protein
MAETNETTAPTPPPESISREEVAGLLKRGESWDKTCLPRLQEVLLAEADGRRHGGLLDFYGSSQQWLRSVLVDSTSRRDLIIKEATRTKVDQLRRELEGLNPTPIECSLAERAAFCWFLVYKYKFIFESANEPTIRQAEYQQRRIDAAHLKRRPTTRRAQPSDAHSLFARISVGASVAPIRSIELEERSRRIQSPWIEREALRGSPSARGGSRSRMVLNSTRKETGA